MMLTILPWLFAAALLALLAYRAYASRPTPATLPEATREIRGLLGIQHASQLVSISKNVDSFLVPDFLRALEVILTEGGLTVETRDMFCRERLYEPSLEDLWNYLVEGAPPIALTPPQLSSYATGLDEEQLFPARALHIVRHPEHPAVFFMVHASTLQKHFRICGFTRDNEAAKAWLAGVMERFTEWVKTHNGCRRRVIRPSFDPYAQTTTVEFLTLGDSAEILQSPGVVEQLRENFLVFKEQEAELARMGVETQRGLLFCGPPGNGKTSTLRFLKRALPEHTFLVPALSSLGDVSQLFALAKLLAPSLVVLEDVDLYLMSRDHNPFVSVLGQLMNEMDGLQPRHRVDVIMSSNSWKAIEQALARRPGRIDHVIQFDNPGDEQRRQLLERFLRDVPHVAPLEALVALTEGMAVAQIKEVVKKSVGRALEARKGSAPLRVGMAEFQHAARIVRENPFQPRTMRPRSLRRDPEPFLAVRPVTVPPAEDDGPEEPLDV